MDGQWNLRQTVLAVLVAVAVGVVGGGAIYAATDSPVHDGGPGGFGPPGATPRSLLR